MIKNKIIFGNENYSLANSMIFFTMILFVLFCRSLWERKEYPYSFEKIDGNEIVGDFTKINPGSWDTLMFVAPYTTAEQFILNYFDSEFLEKRALDDSRVVGAFLQNEKLIGFTACGRYPFDLFRLFEDLDSIFVLKIPRSEAVFRFIKNEEGRFQLKK